MTVSPLNEKILLASQFVYFISNIMSSRKYNQLTLEQKYDIITRIDKKENRKTIMDEYNIKNTGTLISKFNSTC